MIFWSQLCVAEDPKSRLRVVLPPLLINFNAAGEPIVTIMYLCIELRDIVRQDIYVCVMSVWKSIIRKQDLFIVRFRFVVRESSQRLSVCPPGGFRLCGETNKLASCCDTREKCIQPYRVQWRGVEGSGRAMMAPKQSIVCRDKSETQSLRSIVGLNRGLC